MDANALLMQIVLGGLLGVVGQGLRVVVGMKKLFEDAQRVARPVDELFSRTTFFYSLFVGFLAGVLAILFSTGTDLNAVIDRNAMATVLAAGYAGADFIEGLTSKFLPK